MSVWRGNFIMKIKQITIVRLVGLALIASAAAADADTVTYTQTIAPTAGPEDFIAPFSQFDPALGTLTGATLSVSEATSGYAYVEDLDVSGFLAVGSGRGEIGVNMPTIDSVSAFSSWSGNGVFLSPFDGVADFAGSDSAYFSGSNSNTASDLFPATAPLSNFIGSGFLFSEIIVSQYTGFYHYPGYYNFLYYNTVSGDVSLTYTYTPNAPSPGVPEPATWSLMLLGFAGSGAALRSRRKPAPAVAG